MFMFASFCAGPLYAPCVYAALLCFPMQWQQGCLSNRWRGKAPSPVVGIFSISYFTFLTCRLEWFELVELASLKRFISGHDGEATSSAGNRFLFSVFSGFLNGRAFSLRLWLLGVRPESV